MLHKAVTRTSATLLNVCLSAISLCLTLFVLELVERIYSGGGFTLQSLTAEPESGSPGRMEYHARLGWSPGIVDDSWSSSVDAAGIRSNGRALQSAGRPALAVGDSFAFGDEVNDSETWPAQLEQILRRRVLNAGVGAYGIDQAYLRTEMLLDEHDPDLVLLSFIGNDIDRTEFAYYPYAFGPGHKPYFAFDRGSLVLRNVPVPQTPAPPRRLQGLRHVLGYSFLADAVLRRLAPAWWRNTPVIERIHTEGERVSVDLLVRLNARTRERKARLFARRDHWTVT